MWRSRVDIFWVVSVISEICFASVACCYYMGVYVWPAAVQHMRIIHVILVTESIMTMKFKLEINEQILFICVRQRS